jgi:hypothetical protein
LRGSLTDAVGIWRAAGGRGGAALLEGAVEPIGDPLEIPELFREVIAGGEEIAEVREEAMFAFGALLKFGLGSLTIVGGGFKEFLVGAEALEIGERNF